METKADMVLNFIRLGMSFNRACLAAGLSFEEEEALSENKDFIRNCDTLEACLEYDLLERQDLASKVAELKGNASFVQWKLERINPNKWSRTTKQSIGFDDEKGGNKLILNVVRGKIEDVDKEG